MNVPGVLRALCFSIYTRPVSYEGLAFPANGFERSSSGLYEGRISFSHASVAGIVEALTGLGMSLIHVSQSQDVVPGSPRIVRIGYGFGLATLLTLEQEDWVRCRLGEYPYRRVTIDRYSMTDGGLRLMITCGHFERAERIRRRLAIRPDGSCISEEYPGDE